eukprot:Opistho-2@37630
MSASTAADMPPAASISSMRVCNASLSASASFSRPSRELTRIDISIPSAVVDPSPSPEPPPPSSASSRASSNCSSREAMAASFCAAASRTAAASLSTADRRSIALRNSAAASTGSADSDASSSSLTRCSRRDTSPALADTAASALAARERNSGSPADTTEPDAADADDADCGDDAARATPSRSISALYAWDCASSERRSSASTASGSNPCGCDDAISRSFSFSTARAARRAVRPSLTRARALAASSAVGGCGAGAITGPFPAARFRSIVTSASSRSHSFCIRSRSSKMERTSALSVSRGARPSSSRKAFSHPSTSSALACAAARASSSGASTAAMRSSMAGASAATPPASTTATTDLNCASSAS